MIDVSIIIQSFQLGELVGDWVIKISKIKHLNEMIQGFECLNNAECMEDIRMAYRYFKVASSNDKKIVQACSLYGKAICLPFMREYDNAILCVEKLRQMEYSKQPWWFGGTWFYKTIEGFQAKCDNLLDLIDEVKKEQEIKSEPKLEPLPCSKRSWQNIVMVILVILLVGTLVCLFIHVQ